MRLVFDTNILISALLSPKSIAAKILNWAENNPKDDKFIDIAINGGASHIITGDNDLLVLHPIQNITVINLRNFSDEFLD